MKFINLYVQGGIIDFRLYQYPEGPKAAMSKHQLFTLFIEWTMRNIFSVEDRLKNIPYPDPSTQIQSDPINIQFILPEYVFVTEDDDIKVGVWDEKEQVWQTDVIDEY